MVGLIVVSTMVAVLLGLILLGLRWTRRRVLLAEELSDEYDARLDRELMR